MSYPLSYIYRLMKSAAKEIDPYFALADPTRRKILALISNRECSVNSLVEQFDMSQPAISQHLKILRSSGIVSVRRDRRRRLYTVDFQRLKGVHDWVSQFEEYWETKMDALSEYLQTS
jgi:DNA-binding transcriptional ArsR family regulator